MEKGSFWETLAVTDLTFTLGNAAAHRLHQLKVRAPKSVETDHRLESRGASARIRTGLAVCVSSR